MAPTRKFDLLSGKLREIGEIRFKADKQYRILVFFGPGRSEFTMLIGCNKKGNVYDPRNSLETAFERMVNVKADGRMSRVYDR
jgi:hypothetical protein